MSLASRSFEREECGGELNYQTVLSSRTMSTHGLVGTSYRRPRGTRHGKATAWNSIRCDMKQIVLIIGHICSGKSRLARDLARDFGFRPVKTSEVVRRHAQERRRPTDRLSLQALGDELDRSTSGGGGFEEAF